MATKNSDFYLHLEDDIRPLHLDWVTVFSIFIIRYKLNKIDTWFRNFMEVNESFGTVLFAHLHVPEEYKKDKYAVPINSNFNGFFGVIMSSQVARGFANFTYNHFNNGPIDWLFGVYIRSIQLPFYNVKENLFEHAGSVSTKNSVLEFEYQVTVQLPSKLTKLRWDDCIFIPNVNGMTYGIGILAVAKNISVAKEGNGQTTSEVLEKLRTDASQNQLIDTIPALELIRIKETPSVKYFESYHLSIRGTTAEVYYKSLEGLIEGIKVLDSLVARNALGLRIYGVPLDVIV